MSYKPRYVKGDWTAICDACGRKFKASTLRKRWDGSMVCRDDFESRHPQDFVRAVSDTQVAPWIRDEPQDSFVAIYGPLDVVAIAGVAETGVAQGGATYPSWYGAVPSSSFTV